MERYTEVLLVACPIIAVLAAYVRAAYMYRDIRVNPEPFLQSVLEVEADEARDSADRNKTIAVMKRRMALGSSAASLVLFTIWGSWLVARYLERGSDSSYSVSGLLMWMTLVSLAYVAASLPVHLARITFGRYRARA